MTDSIVTQIGTVLLINDVSNIIVTEMVDDGEGGFVRSIRIFGQPLGDQGPAIVELKVKGTTKAAIDITTPVLNF